MPIHRAHHLSGIEDRDVAELREAILAMPPLSESDTSFRLERLGAAAGQLSDVAAHVHRAQHGPVPSISDYLQRSRLSTLLVLGKDTPPEVEWLRTIVRHLRDSGYKPVLVKELPDVEEMSNEDKVRSFADASRFVVLENTFPAGQIAECKILSTNRIVTAFLRQEGAGSSYMVTDYHQDFDFMEEFTYQADDPESLRLALRRACDWAEQKIAQRREFFNERYPWRTAQRTELSG